MTEVLFEFVRVGHSVKVTAIEPETKIEASVVVPDTLSQDQMKFQALNRLKYVLRKKRKRINSLFTRFQ